VRVERQCLMRLAGGSGGVLFTIRTYVYNVLDVPAEHRCALLASLDPDSRTTPLSRHQKEDFGPRIRAAFATAAASTAAT